MDTRFYQSLGLDTERMVRDLERIFLAQGYQVQHFGNREQTVFQLRQGSDFEAIIGMQAALTLTLQRVSGGVTAVISQQQWIDKAAAGALGMLFLWPLAITAGAGIIRQASLENQVLSTLDSVVLQQRSDVKIGPLPYSMQEHMQQQGGSPNYSQGSPMPGQVPGAPQSGQIYCSNCRESNDFGDLYCSHCGKPLTPPKKQCPQCKAEVKSKSAFCTKCGTAFSPS